MKSFSTDTQNRRSAILGAKNDHLAAHSPAAIALFCQWELDFYRDQLDDPGCDEYADFCRGAIKANQRLLTEMERIEASQ